MENDNCHMNGKHHSEEFKKKIGTRLKRIEGQVRGINKMIQNDVYCDDILNQITSIRSALSGVSTLLLEAHIESCVIDKIKNDDDEVIQELSKTIRKMLK
ncbi:MAG: metal-sensitive transcriptional regulator [Fusobacteriota bacterium]